MRELQESVEDLPESKLQAQIEKWCKDNGFPYYHDYSRGKNKPGFPDIIIALPGGWALWLELKSKTGRLSKEQEQWRLKLMALGHEHYVIKSYRQFLEVVRDKPL
jgi:hypothetical protein